MKRLCLSLAFWLLSLPAFAQAVAHPAALVAGAFYISPNGSDSNACTLAAPCLTFAHCQTVMQGGNKNCYVRAGVYAPAAVLSFTSSDNGESWLYYPPDGLQTAYLSGANMPATTVGWTTTSTTTPFTINGLSFKSLLYIWFFLQGNFATFKNNLIDGTGTSTGTYFALDLVGNGNVITGNTVQNLKDTVSGGGARAIQLNATGFTNGVISNNNLWCNTSYQIYLDNGGTNGLSTGNLIYNNQLFNTGQTGGGTAPNCPSVVDISGTGVDNLSGNTNNYYFGNNIGGQYGQQGYALVGNMGSTGSGVTSTNLMISDNTLFGNSDPNITLNGAAGVVIRRNTVNSPGSVGFNLGDEHNVCIRTGTSNGLLVSNNTISSAGEGIMFTGSNSSNIFGNTMNIGTNNFSGANIMATWNGHIATTTLTVDNSQVNVAGGIVPSVTYTARAAGITSNTVITAGSGPTYTVSQSQTLASAGSPIAMNGGQQAPHYFSGISFLNWQYDDYCTSFTLHNNNDTVVNNTITSSAGAAKYGVYLEGMGTGSAGYSTQTAITISHNILYPFGSSGTAAIQDNSGGTNTTADNKITVGGSVTAAPPTANAGPSQAVMGGQLVTLDGSGTANFGSTTGAITYAWSQLSGPTVALSSTTVPKPTFTAPLRPIAQTTTVTIATPAVVTPATVVPEIGMPVKFTTTGALPTGITSGTTYYVIATGHTGTQFEFSTTLGGSAVNTSGSQSGTHTLTGIAQSEAMVFQLVATNANGSTTDQVVIGVDPSL